MQIKQPYLLFIGDAKDPLSIKLAQGVADWRPEIAVGEMVMEGCEVSTGLPRLDLQQAIEQGAKTLVLGFTNSGGTIDPAWLPDICRALHSGLDIASGLHQRLDSIAELDELATKLGRRLIDVRHPDQQFTTGKGKQRNGKRLLTVGTDCSVGKMYTALAIEQEMRRQSFDVSFRATGQCGIFIAGQGVAIDCVVADFISGAVESLAPDNRAEHWDIIEGQGSLFHPSFAGVSLGLLHGSQADALVLCHVAERSHMRGIEHQPLPDVEQTIAVNLQHARLTNPHARLAGMAINTSMISAAAAEQLCRNYQQKFKLPCVDPMRHGVAAIVNNLETNS